MVSSTSSSFCLFWECADGLSRIPYGVLSGNLENDWKGISLGYQLGDRRLPEERTSLSEVKELRKDYPEFVEEVVFVSKVLDFYD